ncbi:MAG: hypothetical protein O2905_02000 [Proteobacteria bacterium]|nr:hypothetical protein [Pseudomonadota bacterium]MDA1131984.1 hypothetical protein [Pseudomonadota bacterium]
MAHPFEVSDSDAFWELISKSAPQAVAVLNRVGPEGAERVRAGLAELVAERFGDSVLRFSNEAHVAAGIAV